MLDGPEGSTPLDPDDAAGLIPDLKTRIELNEFEQSNIADALKWAYKSQLLRKDLLSTTSLKRLHERMFHQTWNWAGDFRTRDTNIGVHWRQIGEQIRLLCDNTKFQIEQNVFGWDELAARFHHRLVLIHPFPNGNGRHARLATDLLLKFNQQKAFSWGNKELTNPTDARKQYLKALRDADRGNFRNLLNFVRT